MKTLLPSVPLLSSTPRGPMCMMYVILQTTDLNIIPLGRWACLGRCGGLLLLEGTTGLAARRSNDRMC